MRPDIRTRAGPTDFERPHIHESNVKIGSSQLIAGAVGATAIADDSLTPAKARYDLAWGHGVDFGEVGITDFSIGTWTEKSFDGGVI